MDKVAVIFGTQRCGSNFFLSACKKIDNLTVFGEMYHRGGVFPFEQDPQLDYAARVRLAEIIRSAFAEHCAGLFDGWNAAAPLSDEANATVNKALVRFSHKNPNRYFEALHALANKGRMIFKIFPEHLDMAQILSILREQRPRVLFLLRNPLDTFISYKKLVETGKPQGVDTSAVKIRFNPAEYFAYKAATATYYRTIKEYCDHESLTVSSLHYEWLHGSPTENKVDMICGQLQRVFGEPVKLGPHAKAAGLFERQDKSETPAEKVLNPAALPRSPQYLLTT